MDDQQFETVEKTPARRETDAAELLRLDTAGEALDTAGRTESPELERARSDSRADAARARTTGRANSSARNAHRAG